MPGFNQRGPMNEGPMTGQGKGDCTRRDSTRKNTIGQNRGGRCRKRGYQADGRGMGYGQRAADEKTPFFRDKSGLQDHAQMLEKELMAVKKQIKNLSEVEE